MTTAARPLSLLATVGALAAVAALAACESSQPVDGVFCDATHPCTDPRRPVCTNAHYCVAPAVGDGALDAAGDAAPTDASLPDLALPDLWMCAQSAECPVVRPVCASGACGPCVSDGDCASHPATPACSPSGACLECLTAAHCAPIGKACDTTSHTCVPCATHADCATRVCKDDKSCAAASEVLYVSGDGCAGAKHAGDLADPYCDIRDALTALGGHKFVVVAASDQPYGPVDVSGGVAVTLVGPGGAAVKTASIQSGVAVRATGAGTALVVDGLRIALANVGVVCESGATLALRRSRVESCKDVGVAASGCKLLTLDGDVVVSNANGGVSVATSGYAITNTIVGANAKAAGIKLDDASSGTLAFDTIAGNGATGKEGGVVCGFGGDKVIESSIVAGNAQKNGTQLVGSCLLAGVVTGTDSYKGAIQLAPKFKDATKADFHLVDDKANADCCVDKVKPGDGGALLLPDHDVDFAHRPKGAGWDIGAHELK